MENPDVIIVGAGLAGLSCAYELSAKGKHVLVLERNAYAGGRASSFYDSGMKAESGLHRYIGYYSALPSLLKKCGVCLNDIITWEEKMDILVKEKDRKVVLGVAPVLGFRKTVRGVLENQESLTAKEKWSLVPFFICGFAKYLFSRDLDTVSVAEYAQKHHVKRRAQRLILEPLSTGIFFLPPENYSAYAFFGLFAPAIPKFYKMRIGAFLGGMTEVMCNPVVREATKAGCRFQFGAKVSEVIVKEGRMIGVRMENGQEHRAGQTVIASTLQDAKKILAPLKGRSELEKLYALPVMSACCLQLELDQPALEKDITVFGPGTDMVSFAEQSRTTFQTSKGRLSVILGNPKEYCKKSAEDILNVVITQMEELGIHLRGHVLDVRKTAEEDSFYSLAPGSQKLRPPQRTGIAGLTLAGDYTKTASFATMEGAVLSGKKAAKAVCTAHN